MSTQACYVDTSVLLLAVGEPTPMRDVAAGFLGAPGRTLHLSVEGVQEFLSHRMRRAGREVALDQTETLMASVVLHPFDRDVLLRSMDLVRTTGIRGRDAVHAATALHLGIDMLVTLDRDFAGVPGLQVVEP